MRIRRAIAPGNPGAEMADGFGEECVCILETQIRKDIA